MMITTIKDFKGVLYTLLGESLLIKSKDFEDGSIHEQ